MLSKGFSAVKLISFFLAASKAIGMNDLERFLNVMEYRPVDRCPYGVLTGAWPETIKRWVKEGYDPLKEPLFKADHWEWIGNWFFPNPPFGKEIVSEDERTITYVNPEGILMRERKDNPLSSMPQFIRFPVENKDDFYRFMRERMKPDLASRIGKNYESTLSSYRERSFPLIIVADRWGGFFGPLRNLVGLKRLVWLFYNEPDFVDEMMDSIADFIILMMERILSHTTVDVFGFWEDMACKNGPLLNPRLVRRSMLPRYRRVIKFLNSHGVRWISLDSDGDISLLIPIWLEAGINIIYPFEVQAGMDVVKIRKTYGRKLRMWGGVDKRAIAAGPSAIDAELKRVAPLVREGGYVPAPDHGLPPDISFTNYCYYMERLKALVEGEI